MICVPVVGNMTAYYTGTQSADQVKNYLLYHLAQEMNAQRVSISGVKETFFVGTRRSPSAGSANAPPLVRDDISDNSWSIGPLILSITLGGLFVFFTIVFATRRRRSNSGESEGVGESGASSSCKDASPAGSDDEMISSTLPPLVVVASDAGMDDSSMATSFVSAGPGQDETHDRALFPGADSPRGVVEDATQQACNVEAGASNAMGAAETAIVTTAIAGMATAAGLMAVGAPATVSDESEAPLVTSSSSDTADEVPSTPAEAPATDRVLLVPPEVVADGATAPATDTIALEPVVPVLEPVIPNSVTSENTSLPVTTPVLGGFAAAIGGGAIVSSAMANLVGGTPPRAPKSNPVLVVDESPFSSEGSPDSVVAGVSMDNLPPLPPGGPSAKTAAATVQPQRVKRRRKKKKLRSLLRTNSRENISVMDAIQENAKEDSGDDDSCSGSEYSWSTDETDSRPGSRDPSPLRSPSPVNSVDSGSAQPPDPKSRPPLHWV
jgi:hypothetical protein